MNCSGFYIKHIEIQYSMGSRIWIALGLTSQFCSWQAGQKQREVDFSRTVSTGSEKASSENKFSKSFFKNPFWDPFQNRKPDPKVCGERTWLPIYKMVWHLTIGSAAWMLELSKVGCEDFVFWRRGGGKEPDTSVLVHWYNECLNVQGGRG